MLLSGAGLVEDLIGFRAQRCQRAAADRLHHDDGQAGLGEHLILTLRVLQFPVQVIELDLRELPRSVGYDLAQHFGGVVEGEAQVANAAGFLLLLQVFERAELLHALKRGGVQRVAEVEVKILRAAALELILKDGRHILGLVHHPHRHLRGQVIALARIFLQRLADTVERCV